MERRSSCKLRSTKARLVCLKGSPDVLTVGKRMSEESTTRTYDTEVLLKAMKTLFLDHMFEHFWSFHISDFSSFNFPTGLKWFSSSSDYQSEFSITSIQVD